MLDRYSTDAFPSGRRAPPVAFLATIARSNVDQCCGWPRT
jgi:hypothetical protein